MDSFRLDGKTALVTGAGRGIGRAVALALATAGAELILVSRTQSQLEEVAREIEKDGGKSRVLPFDVTDTAAMHAAFSGILRLDILVNNAGLNRPQPFLDVDEATLDRLLTLNVRAAFLVAQAVARLMVARRSGVIVNMSSQMGHVGSDLNRTVYVMTKHAIEGLTKAMAVELAPKGVRVVSVAPTFVQTPSRSSTTPRPGSGSSTASHWAAPARSRMWRRRLYSSPPLPPVSSPARRCWSTAAGLPGKG